MHFTTHRPRHAPRRPLSRRRSRLARVAAGREDERPQRATPRRLGMEDERDPPSSEAAGPGAAQEVKIASRRKDGHIGLRLDVLEMDIRRLRRTATPAPLARESEAQHVVRRSQTGGSSDRLEPAARQKNSHAFAVDSTNSRWMSVCCYSQRSGSKGKRERCADSFAARSGIGSPADQRGEKRGEGC